MELQWNFEESGATTECELTQISKALKNAVIPMFENNQKYYDLDSVSRFQEVFEVLSFLFEDYREQYQDIITTRMGEKTPEQHQVQALVFCSWHSMEVMQSLAESKFRSEVNSVLKNDWKTIK